ncbi:response regulator [Rhodobacteraceae bacterium NNCM2]|nr:response regulator [Coraliihabitans acroporae]
MTVTASEEPRESLSVLIAPHLPYLRRYARALAGSQGSGDAYVASVLEAIIADIDMFDRKLDSRVALYKIFTAIWSSGNIDTSVEATPDNLVARTVSRLTPRSRQMLLLTTVEEFSDAEAATIMDVAPDEAALLMADAQAELASQARARVMIIEDEPVIALDLESIVGGMGHETVGIADTHKTAVKLAEETEPDLILADIQLADGSSGIEAVEEILGAHQTPVVFITAYPERLLTGQRPEPTYLVTKPFRPETVEAAVGQALFHKSRPGG